MITLYSDSGCTELVPNAPWEIADIGSGTVYATVSPSYAVLFDMQTGLLASYVSGGSCVSLPFSSSSIYQLVGTDQVSCASGSDYFTCIQDVLTTEISKDFYPVQQATVSGSPFENIFPTVGSSTPPTQNLAIVNIPNLDLFMLFVAVYMVFSVLMGIFKRK